MKAIYPTLFILMLSVFGLTGCLEEDLAFEVLESPVLVVFEDLPATTDAINIRAVFYDLDKSGILDHSVGIDSVPIANLSIEVFTNESIPVGSYTTDSEGVILFSEPMDKVGSADRLEWVGNYEETDFRIYKKL